MAKFTDRMIRAARLDPQLYEEVEADTTALGQATAVVILSSVAAGIGSAGPGAYAHLLLMTTAALLGWYVWAFMTWWIGTKFLPEKETQATYGQLLRTIGFSSAPGILKIFGMIPVLNALVFAVANIWMLAAMVVAVRQALDYKSTPRAVGVCLMGWLIQFLLLALLLSFMASSVDSAVRP